METKSTNLLWKRKTLLELQTQGEGRYLANSVLEDIMNKLEYVFLIDFT